MDTINANERKFYIPTFAVRFFKHSGSPKSHPFLNRTLGGLLRSHGRGLWKRWVSNPSNSRQPPAFLQFASPRTRFLCHLDDRRARRVHRIINPRRPDLSQTLVLDRLNILKGQADRLLIGKSCY